MIKDQSNQIRSYKEFNKSDFVEVKSTNTYTQSNIRLRSFVIDKITSPDNDAALYLLCDWKKRGWYYSEDIELVDLNNTVETEVLEIDDWVLTEDGPAFIIEVVCDRCDGITMYNTSNGVYQTSFPKLV